MRGEDQRHEQLRRLALQAHRDHDNDGQQRGDGTVQADDGSQCRAKAHHQNQKTRAAVLARLLDQQLAGPGGDAGLLQCSRHHEKRGDEHYGGITIASQRIGQRQEARRPQ